MEHTARRSQLLPAGILAALLALSLNATAVWMIMEPQRSWWRSTAVCLLLLGQVAAVAVAAGNWPARPAFRWLMYCCCLLVVDLWMFAYLSWHADPFDQSAFLHALVTGQITPIVLAAGLAIRSPAWALPAAVAALFAMAWCFLWAMHLELWDDVVQQLLLIGQGVALCGVIAALRGRGYRLVTSRLAHEAGRDVRARLRLSFSLRQLLYWLVAIAVVLASLRAFRRPWHPYEFAHDGVQAALLAVQFALVVWGTVWVAATRRHILLSMTALLIVEFGLGFAGQAAFAIWHHAYFPWARYAAILMSDFILLWAVWPALVSDSLATMLLMMRASGYRLQRVPAQIINTIQPGD